jgi:hypothetical protein
MLTGVFDLLSFWGIRRISVISPVFKIYNLNSTITKDLSFGSVITKDLTYRGIFR